MANVARLDLEPMSPGRPTSGNASGGGKRSKSGEFSSVSDSGGVQSLTANKPASIAPEAPEIDSAWEAAESTERAESTGKALAPKRVISIGPPTPTTPVPSRASSPAINDKRRQIEPVVNDQRRRSSFPPAEEKSDVELLNRPSRALEKLLTEGPESNFGPSDIAQLVTDVMGNQKPSPLDEKVKVSARPAVSVANQATGSIRAAQYESIAPVSIKAVGEQSSQPSDSLMEPDGWDVPLRPLPKVVETAPVTSEPPAKASPTPTPKSTRKSGKARQIAVAKKSVPAEKSKVHATHEGLDTELAVTFFTSDPHVQSHVDEFHEPYDLIDERHLRSLSPEVQARRAKYRRIVLGLFVGMVLLLAAAIALRYFDYR